MEPVRNETTTDTFAGIGESEATRLHRREMIEEIRQLRQIEDHPETNALAFHRINQLLGWLDCE